MTITGLELREQTWKALGWKFERRPFNDYTVECWWNPDGIGFDFLPPIEGNNGIALDELVKFCPAENLIWQVEESPIGGYACHLRATPKRIGRLSYDAGGSTPAETIRLALIQAASVKANGR